MSSLFTMWGKLPAPPTDRAGDPRGPNQKYFYSASAGHVLSTDGSGYVVPELDSVSGERREYIPRDVAVEKVRDLVKENAANKELYTQNIQKVNEFYEKTLDESKSHYERIIQDLRDKALRHVDVQKQLRKNIEDRLNQELKSTEDALEELRDNMANLNHRYQDEVKLLKSRVAETEASLDIYKRQLATTEATTTSTEILWEIAVDAEILTLNKQLLLQKDQLELDRETVRSTMQQQLDELREKMKLKTEEVVNDQFVRHECSLVLNSILQKIDINNLAENVKQITLMEADMDKLRQALQQAEERVEVLSNELNSSVVSRNLLAEKGKETIEEIEKLSKEFAEERDRLLEDKSTTISHLKSKFNVILKKMKTDHDRTEVHCSLLNIVAQVASDVYVESQNSLLNSITSQNLLKSQAGKDIELIEQQSRHQQLALEDKIKKLKIKFQSILTELKAKNDRLQVELTVSQLVNRVCERHLIERSEAIVAQRELMESLHQKSQSELLTTNGLAEQGQQLRQGLIEQIDTLKEQLTAANNEITNQKVEIQILAERAASAVEVIAPAVVTEPETPPNLIEILGKIKMVKDEIANRDELIQGVERIVLPYQQEREQMKLEIKEWTRLFQEANGHDPENADKNQIRDKYQRYKVSSVKSKEFEKQIESAQTERESLQTELNDLQDKYRQLTNKSPRSPRSQQQQRRAQSPRSNSPRTNDRPTSSSRVKSATPVSPRPAAAVVRMSSSEKVKSTSDAHIVESKPEMIDAEVQVTSSELRTQATMKRMPTVAALITEQGQGAISEEAQRKFQERLDEMQKVHDDALEQLEDQIFALKEEHDKLRAENAKIVEEKVFINNQLEVLIKEKRTDVIKRFEDDLERLHKVEAELNEKVTTLATEKQKLETRVLELKDRAEHAETELKERDQKDIQILNPGDEKVHLKGQISKQRDQIILKSKAATAGWDAAANADEKLDLEVQKAYARGAKEEKEKHKNDLEAVHKSLEGKEQRITDLLLQIVEMEKKVKSSESSQEAMKNQVENMKLEVADAIAGIQLMAATATGGNVMPQTDADGELIMPPSAAELERAQEQLDQAQDELVQISERCDRLETELEMARQKNRIFEKLATMTGLTSGIAAPVSGGGAGVSSTSKRMNDLSQFDLNETINIAKRVVVKGTNMWKSNKKDECFEVYLECCATVAQRLLTDDLARPLRDSTEHGKTQGAMNKQRGAVILRKAIDKFLVDVGQSNFRKAEEDAATSLKNSQQNATDEQNQSNTSVVSDLMNQLNSIDNSFLEQGYTKDRNPGNSSAAGTAEASPRDHPANSSLLQRARSAESQVQSLKKQLAAIIAATATASAPQTSGEVGHIRPTTATRRGGAATAVGAGGAVNAAASGGGADPAEVRRLNRKIKDLEEQVKKAQATGGGGGANSAEYKALQASEKALQKKLKDFDLQSKREAKALEMRATKAENALSKIQGTYDSVKSERDTLRAETDKLIKLTSDLDAFKAKAEQCDQLTSIVASKDQELSVLSEQFKKESTLRKKYKNELEDLKGAIRVYARCRPMARYEIERGCKQSVEIKDETSLKIITSRGEKDFEFDAVFSPTSTQDQVFEDTKRLVESCIDGFNVCVFAYGQTGSGKTFTMTGSPQLPGLTPRTVSEIFRLMDERAHLQCKLTTYFVELYNDNLVDLYWVLDNRNSKTEPPKLEIKMDAKKMVFIRNAVIKEANSPEELMDLFEKGNAERHTGATKMNAESSRSHSIFAIMVESFDTTSKRTTMGKLSLVDLAGSERADKTGAGAERLKEAQSINKSLSALGDVIAALSEGGSGKFIPYRNNKLTQLMQDSLGGNAKTLMFVNFSPADYNSDETSTSLMYAARVKKIVNNASKQAESEEVARLKQIIKRLQSGQAIADLEPPEPVIDDGPPPDNDDEKVYDGY